MSRPGLSYSPLLSSWNVGSVVADICDRANLEYDTYDTSLLEGSVEGFSTTNSVTAAAAIEALSSLYMFDAANFNEMLNFIPRGGSVVADIELNDMIGDDDVLVESNRKDGIGIPRLLSLEYYDTEGGLTPDKQTSDRTLDNRSTADSKTETTVLMRADDAARAVVIKHKVAVEESRGTVSFKLDDSWIGLSVADVVRVMGQRMRITDIQIDDGFQSYTCSYDRKSAYESTISGVPIDQPTTPPGLVASESVMEIIDSHILQSIDDRLGYYVAVSSVDLDWRGAYVELSMDGGQNWIDADATGANMVLGKTITGMGAHTVYYRDDVNSIDIELLRPDMELESATMEEMMNRNNLAIIGNELINFSNVEQLTEKTWRISGFLRGRKGSPISSHATNERFVLLDVDALYFADAELYDIGRTLTFKVTSIGREGPDQVKTIVYNGNSQRERQPAYLHARRVGGNIVINWQGVGRTGGGAGVGMGQYFQTYRVTVGSTVTDTTQRTLSVSDPGGAVTISVRQVNSLTGQGPAISVTI